jgi:hypothetical protein
MATFKGKGTVGKSDLEGGFWTFETEAGDVYQLDGGGKDLLHAGATAEIDGTVDEEAMGIGFGAAVLKVKSYKLT